jgi:hypothetical protein
MAVTPDDIAVELGRTAPAPDEIEFTQWERWIADALMLISARLGDVSELDQDRLDYVVRLAVAAHVRRPDDATQVAVSVDDGSVSRTYRSSRGRVEIIDDWWALLSPTDTGGSAFSITPYSGASPHMPWCTLLMGGLYCSCGADLTNYAYPLFEGGVLTEGDYY